jgi:hydroxymethylpyrimidine pyrophosphatase-like HAD family hydrolase
MASCTGEVTPPIAAVLADVDGTLVTKDKVLTPRAIRAVRELQDLGVLFAVTSGRPPRGVTVLVEPLRMQGPIAAFNGGIVVLPDMTVVDERPIPAHVAPAVIETIRAHGLYVWIYRSTEWYITDPDAPARGAGIEDRPVPAHGGSHVRRPP